MNPLSISIYTKIPKIFILTKIPNYSNIDYICMDKNHRKMRRIIAFAASLVLSAGLLTAAFAMTGEVPEWVWLLKYAGTAAVTVTMLTVFLFLAPSVGKDWVKVLLTGTPSDLFMHLLTPAAALVSFCVFENRGMSFMQALWGMLPVLLYGILYIRKILYAPAEKRWEDFYGFNRGGKMAVSAAGMLAGTFIICMVLMGLQNL